MRKSEKSSLKKGRWLVLEQTNHTKEAVLALIRAMDGAEIQMIDAKTYVRFPERRTQAVKPLSKAVNILHQKRAEIFWEDTDAESPRQYCAVMLKNGR